MARAGGIEANELDFLAPTYVRGFVRSYARYLEVNEEPLLEEFDRRFGRVGAQTSVLEVLEARAKGSRPRRKRLSSWNVAAALAAVVLVAMAVVGVINQPGGNAGRQAAERNEDGAGDNQGRRDQSGADPSPTARPDEGAVAQADGTQP